MLRCTIYVSPFSLILEFCELRCGDAATHFDVELLLGRDLGVQEEGEGVEKPLAL